MASNVHSGDSRADNTLNTFDANERDVDKRSHLKTTEVSSAVEQRTKDSVPESVSTQAAGVSLRAVTKRYGNVTAIENVSLDIPAGAYCCLLGPSGCGKTTTLRMIAGHEAVSSGEVLIGDQPVTHLPPAKRNTAMMFQNYALFPHKTVWQNVAFGLKMKGVKKAERSQRVGEILELVDLSHTADRKPDQLSGGQQQRIALARALVNRPQVLMLDEPLSALDENLRVRMRGELRKIQQQFGLTFIQVTHHVEEAFSLSDQVVVMDHGHIEQIATPQTLFTTPASQFVAKFIGDNNIFSGTVVSSSPTMLSVEGVGNVVCQSDAVTPSLPVGEAAACCVRPDLLKLMPVDVQSDETENSKTENYAIARITQVELTGYVMRVLLTLESTGQTLLHKTTTTSWMTSGLQAGQRVAACWSAQDCVFLPY